MNEAVLICCNSAEKELVWPNQNEHSTITFMGLWVSFDLKIGKKDIRQVYIQHALLCTGQRTWVVNNLIVEDYYNLIKSESENSI